MPERRIQTIFTEVMVCIVIKLLSFSARLYFRIFFLLIFTATISACGGGGFGEETLSNNSAGSPIAGDGIIPTGNPSDTTENDHDNNNDSVSDSNLPLPSVLTTSPEENQIDVSLNSAIAFTFDNPVTLSDATITADYGELVDQTLAGSWTLDENATTATFTPSDEFEIYTSYIITLSGATDETEDNTLASTKLKFKTNGRRSLSIADQPQDTTAFLNNSVSFSVSVSGQGPITYQWFKDDIALTNTDNTDNTDNATLTLIALSETDAGKYQVVVADKFASIASQSITLVIYGIPSIDTQPSDLQVDEGDSATFSTSASGNGSISYQWFRDNQAIKGATSSSLAITKAHSDDIGRYFCRITNEAGATDTDAADLIVALTPSLQYTLTTQISGNGSIQSNVSGINCGTDCSESFDEYSAVSLTATADSAYQFSGWSGSCTGTGNCDLTMNQDQNVTATFTAFVAPIISSHPSDVSVNEGASAAFTTIATSEETLGLGYQWYKDSQAISNATSSILNIDSATTADQGLYYCIVTNEAGSVTSSTAQLVITSAQITQYTLTTSLSGSGLIQSDVNGIECGTDCTEVFDENSAVTLTATPSSGYQFSGWSGSCTGTGNCDLTMNQDKNVTASFTAFAAPIISSHPSDVSVNEGASAAFTTIATSEETLGLGYQWYKDSQAISNATSSILNIDSATTADQGLYYCIVTNEAGSVTSSTAQLVITSAQITQYTLTTSLSGSGLIQSDVNGIECGTDCTEVFDENSAVTLTATPSSGYQFSGWSGSCSGTNTCDLTMDQDKNITATFTAFIAPIISSHPSDVLVNEGVSTLFTTSATGEGSLNYQWYKDNLEIAGATSTSLAINSTTIADEGWYHCVVTNEGGSVASNTAELAIIPTQVTQYTLTTSLLGSGLIQSDVNGIECGTDCTEMFDENSTLTLTATPDSGYQFTGWSGGCTGTGNCDLTMDATKEVTATFTLIESAGNVTLKWAEPSFYDNGELLSRSEIASYDILWGLSTSTMEPLQHINDSNTLEYVVENLSQGEYYFSISVTTIYGNTSNQSNIVSKIIN